MKCKTCTQSLVPYNELPCSHCPHNPNFKDHYEKTEPKVLTHVEYWENWQSKEDLPVGSHYQVSKEAFEKGHKNGRLERDLEHKELIEQIKLYVNGHSEIYLPDQRSVHARENIRKPTGRNKTPAIRAASEPGRDCGDDPRSCRALAPSGHRRCYHRCNHRCNRHTFPASLTGYLGERISP